MQAIIFGTCYIKAAYLPLKNCCWNFVNNLNGIVDIGKVPSFSPHRFIISGKVGEKLECGKVTQSG